MAISVHALGWPAPGIINDDGDAMRASPGNPACSVTAFRVRVADMDLTETERLVLLKFFNQSVLVEDVLVRDSVLLLMNNLAERSSG